MVYPWGVEQSLLQSVTSAQSKHGLTKDKKIRVWIDCIQEQELANGVLMVTWHSWQMSEGSFRFSGTYIYLLDIIDLRVLQFFWFSVSTIRDSSKLMIVM